MFKPQFKAKNPPRSLQEALKKSGTDGLHKTGFKAKAGLSLRQAGYSKSEAQNILKGKKLEKEELKKVFKNLHSHNIISKGSEGVEKMIKKEINVQKVIFNARLKQRSDEVEIEKTPSANDKSAKKQSPLITAENKHEQVKLLHDDEHHKFYATQQTIQSDLPAVIQPAEEILRLRQEAEDNDLPI